MSLEVMANNSLGPKSKLAAPGTSLRITPSNSPVLKPAARLPNKPSSHQSTLSLQTVIGTTTSTPNGFSSHEPSSSFALCAGSAAILVDLDSELNISQRFFRARPTATGLNAVSSYYGNASTPPVTPESRNRAIPPARGGTNSSMYLGSPAGESAESGRTWSSRERIKAVTSVSISPNGRFLAVGETGYNPRVLIFSTAKDSPLDVPLSILSEHTFGVRSLAFSPNSQYLATLGDMNDGFLFIWAVNLKTGSTKLHSTNKCTSFVRDICWMGLNLITVGIRHVKVWRLGDPTPSSPSKSQRFNLDSHLSSPNPAPKALSGRNCLLGSLSENTFTCVSNISDDEAVVGCDSGAVCLIDDTDGNQKLHLLRNVGFSVASVSVDFDSGTLWLGGRNKTVQKFSIEELKSSPASSPSPSLPQAQENSGSRAKRKPAIICMGLLSSQMVTVDSTRAIRVSPIESLEQGDNSENDLQVSMPAHRDAVLGVGALELPNTHHANFFTWSCGGTVSFWTIQGKCRATKKIELEQPPSGDDEASNELKILRNTHDMAFFVSGDRYGVIRLINGESWSCINEVRAHGGEVTDIAIQSTPELCLIATSGRDRMVQLFKQENASLNLIQTLDDHVGAVGSLLFMGDGEKLLSSSADRTVIIRERLTRDVDGNTTIAFFLSKVITLKASPISMTLAPDDPETLILSTIDRNVQRFNVSTGRHIHSFRASDPETNDSVVMSSLIGSREVPGQSPKLLLGVSTTDKSIRVYDFEKDFLLTREFGHTEGVSDVVLLEMKSSESPPGVQGTLISTGLDGVVMIWELSISQQQPQEPSQAPSRAEDATPAKELTAAKPPLRRILSRSEIADLKGQDTPGSSPTPIRENSPPRLRKRTSRFGLGPLLSKTSGNTNGNGNTSSSTTQLPGSRRSPTANLSSETKAVYDRSPSPQSPKASKTVNTSTSTSNLRRASISVRSRTKSSGQSTGNSEFGSLNMSTEQVCRTLRAYRKKLNGSAATDNLNAASELERELDLTVRALGDRSKRMQANAASQVNGNGNIKEANGKKPPIPPVPTKPTKIKPRRMPSTPNLGQKVQSSKVPRPRSLDADGEG